MKINFAKYLLELLLANGTIDVPGLGKFELVKKSASFGEGRKTLKAPRREIRFDEEHDSEDLILQEAISRGESIDSEKATSFIRQFTSDVLSGLIENGDVEIAYLGLIKRKFDEKIQFVQNEGTVEKLNTWMPEVELPEPQKIVAIPENLPSKAEIVAGNKNIGSTIRTDIKEEISESVLVVEKNASTAWWKWLLPFVAVIAISAILFKMCAKEDKTVYETLNNEEVEALVEDTTALNLVEEEGQIEEVVDIDFKSEDKTEQSIGSGSALSKEQCIVIIGSYQNQRNVQSTTNQIVDKGYRIYKETHGAYTRVGLTVDCEDIEGTLANYLSEISREFGVNAWFLTPEVHQ